MLTETETFVVNPYIAGSPIKDSAMFFGREDVYAWIRQHLRGKYQDNVIVLYGERRSGKTSVLYQMKERLGDERYVPVLLDLQGMELEGMDGFLWGVARKIVLRLRGMKEMRPLDRPVRRDFEDNPRDYFETVFLPPIISRLGERRLLLMFDEANRLEEKVLSKDLSADVFDYLRSLIQHLSQVEFIFSIGNRVEETGASSQLFNLAVYRKISFLDQDFAEDLISRPIAEYYSYTRPAIDRILELTSGQPYYTQLLCHNLFSRWTQYRPEQLDVADVEAVLADVIEQATPNLQFVWDDSKPAEQAVLAALADMMPRYKAGVMRRNLDRRLRRASLYPPAGEVTTGLKTLFERDVIDSQEPYQFRVEILQRWLTEFKRLEWVREELSEVAKEWERRELERQAQAPTVRDKARHWATPVFAGLLVGLLIGVTIYILILIPEFRQRNRQSSAALDAAEATRLAEVNQLEATITAAKSEISSLEDQENASAAEARATAQAAEAVAGIALARVTEFAQKEATANSAATQVAQAAQSGQESAAVAAEVTATQAQAELAALESQTPTPTAFPTPTETATSTPVPTATPRPTATPVPALSGRLAISILGSGGRYNVQIYSVPDGTMIGTIPNARQPNFRRFDGELTVSSEDNRGIWLYDPDGSNGRSITNGSGDSHPSWKPNGQGLVYDNNQDFFRNDRLFWSIFVKDQPEASNSRNASRIAGDIFEASGPLYPLWTPNDKIIFYACNYWILGDGGKCGIWQTDPTATEDAAGFRLPQNLTAQSEIPTDVSGNRFLATGQSNGNSEVFLGSLTDGSLTNLSNHPDTDGLGAFSPNGRWVAFVSNRGRHWEVWVVPATGGEPERLPIDNLSFGGGDRNWTTERISWGS
jgi:hypothetical protein